MPFQKPLLQGFLRQSAEQMDRLTEAAQQRDLAKTARLAHVLANTFVAIRDTSGMKRCYDLEMAAGKQNRDAVLSGLAAVRQELKRARHEAKTRLAEIESADQDMH